MADALIGASFAGYRVDELVGRRGMGVVYRATDVALERSVALKLLAPDLARDESFRRRFATESKVAASLDHPNVIPIYHAGEHDGVLYLAMRSGEDLRLRLGRSGLDRLLAEMDHVTVALQATHAEVLGMAALAGDWEGRRLSGRVGELHAKVGVLGEGLEEVSAETRVSIGGVNPG